MMNSFKILIVDDSIDNIKTIVDHLEKSDQSLKILRAPSGDVALKIAKSKLPDLIITDWEMPGLSGIDLIKELKKYEPTQDIPIIMCTGKMTTSENLNTALQAGAVDFIRKPIDNIELIARINSMLSLSESYKKIKMQKEDLSDAMDEIALEKNKTVNLLHNILPKKIVSDLIQSGQTEPELFKNVTVLFSDIINFTRISAQIEPKVLINELNDIFTEFDSIMERNQCERIKTIGDAYLAVCGMPLPNANHAENMVNSALEMIDYLKLRNEKEKLKWEVRIGIHSGSVTGGIVGTKKYIYDIFGDTVNTASRMESSSEAMKINLSETTCKIVQNKFTFTDREQEEVKGIGLMKMYFIEDK